MEQDDTEQKRHSFLQEEARMLGPIYRAHEAQGHSWRREALCAELVEDADHPLSPDIFFARDGTDASEMASAICFECPVRRQCLQWSCTAKQRHGTFGGLPAFVRLRKGPVPGKPHEFALLVELPNPYLTEDTRSRYHRDNVQAWDGDEDDE